MALDRDELNRRRHAREEQRRKRQAAQRRMYVRLGLAVLVLIVCAVGIFVMSRNSDQPQAQAMATDPEIYEEEFEVTQPETEALSSWEKLPEVIHVVAAGDLNVTDSVVWAGQKGGVYDYTAAFMDVAPIFSEADLALLNFEGNVCGSPFGSQTQSAPFEMIAALKNAGIDVMQLANSCTISNGLIGMQSTLSTIRSQGIEPVGAFANDEEFNRSNGYTVCQVGDVKIALVAFTKGLGGKGLPSGSENCVNLLYEDYYTNYQKIATDSIKKILKNVESEDPDLTIALLHWGSEYNDTISDSQKSIASLMLKNGVDAIIGTHSHMVHQIEYDEETGNLVAYSLGDFFGDATQGGTSYSIILDLEITKDYDSGETRITNYSYTPIYTLTENECDGQRRVVRIENAVSAYDLNYVDKVTKACYDNMQFALDRISKRVTPEPAEAKK